MNMKSFRTFAFFFLLTASIPVTFAQNTETLAVSGEVATPMQLKKSDLDTYKPVTYTARDRDGKEHIFKGVALIEILEKAGATTGSKLRGENLAKLILVRAADGYEVVYALPEVDPEFTDNVVIVATEKDGQPLPAGEGPFRMIAPQDKKQARWAREVREIKVLFARD